MSQKDLGQSRAESGEVQSPIQDCWSRIGVYGDASCSELKTHVHCRNCSVYAKAGGELLNRPLPAEYRRSWTRHFAKERPLRDFDSTSAVPFRTGSEWLALPTECFQEIAERRPIHSVPDTPPAVLGVASVRGELLICISLGHVLGLPGVQPRNLLRAEYERLLVLVWNGHRAGFPVEEVRGPQRFYSEHMKAAATMLTRCNPSYVETLLQWEQRTLALLDPDLVFSAVHRNLS